MSQNIHDRVSSYALGVLDRDDWVQFEEHLGAGCPPCQAELDLDRESIARLASAFEIDPPPGLRERVLGRARQAARFSGADFQKGILFQEAGLLISRSGEMDWKQLAPGVSYKPLFRDEKRKYHTSLVRMGAGATYPSHRHSDVEELFMISGDFHLAGLSMGPGDYCRAEPGTMHGVTHTDSGCVFLLCASELNQVMA